MKSALISGVLFSIIAMTSCGGGGGSGTATTGTTGTGTTGTGTTGTGTTGTGTTGTGTGTTGTGTTGTGTTGTGTTGTGTSGTGTGSTDGGSSGGTTTGGTTTGGTSGTGSSSGLEQKAAALAVKIGKPNRFLVGLGSVDLAVVQKQAIKPDIYDQYLNGVGNDSWRTWNSPAGQYVQIVAKNADTLGAVPMFTLYQMASNGDGNLSGLSNLTFMANYWSNVKLLFQQLKTYGKPALVNFEPDFWGYAQRLSNNADPATVYALVNSESDCANLSNSVKGVAECLMQIARKYAPNAYVGFPPALFEDLHSTALSYMQKLGAGKADFIVMQTLDRDAGCFEQTPQPSYCQRNNGPWYWDESNTRSPNFKEHFALAKTYSDGLQLPILWWQTPLGVPSSTPGGSAGKWRDNRARYFLTHTSEMVAVGGLGAVFSTGEINQTSIETDGGQFKNLITNYLAQPTSLRLQ